MTLSQQGAWPLADVVQRSTTLLRATLEHAIGISDLRRRFWQDQVSKGLLDPVPPVDESACTALIGRPRTSLHVVLTERSIVGYIYGQTKILPGSPPAKVGSIEEIYVNPSARGSAVAATLFEAALSDLREQGAERIQLRVLVENNSGKRFWERLGFRPNLILYELSLAATERPPELRAPDDV